MTTGTEIIINELTTAASTFALAPYINPGTSPGTETIGTSSTTQGATGITNAYESVANLVNTSAGAAIAANTYTGRRYRWCRRRQQRAYR